MNSLVVEGVPVDSGGAARTSDVGARRGFRQLLGLMFLCMLLPAAGCGRGGLNLAPVEGIVTCDGTPVADAGVMFVPNELNVGPPATGSTDSEGRFKLVTVNSPACW